MQKIQYRIITPSDTTEILKKPDDGVTFIYTPQYDAQPSNADYPVCINCGKPSSKQCAKCRRVWYCSRECQVINWKIHKEVCESLLDQVGELPPALYRFGAENCFQLQRYIHSITKTKFITFGSYDKFSYVIGDLLSREVIGINPEPRRHYDPYEKYAPFTCVDEFIKSESDPANYVDSTLFLNWTHRQHDTAMEPLIISTRETELNVIKKLDPAIVFIVFDKYINIHTELLIALTQIPGMYSPNEIIQVGEMLKDVMRAPYSSDIVYAEVLSKSQTLNQYRLDFSIDIYDYNEPDFSVDLCTAPDDIRYIYSAKNQISSKTFTMAVLIRKDMPERVGGGDIPFVFDKKLCKSIINRPEYNTFNIYYRAYKYITEHINLIKTADDMERYIRIVTYWVTEKQEKDPHIIFDDSEIGMKNLYDLIEYLIVNL
jgi:hypothetical protein